MPSTIIMRWILTLAVLLGIAGVFLANDSLNQNDVYEGVVQDDVYEPATLAVVETTNPGVPIRLRIPKINVDSEVEQVGVTADGEMAVPEDISNVGWYEFGVHPGEIGDAVIAGHYGWENNTASAFDKLHELRVGDKIYVENVVGEVITFVVRANRRYDAGEQVPEVFGTNDGESHLNLITCEGDWDPITKSYSKRLIVFTDRE